jgi:hypothetical protein
MWRLGEPRRVVEVSAVFNEWGKNMALEGRIVVYQYDLAIKLMRGRG